MSRPDPKLRITKEGKVEITSASAKETKQEPKPIPSYIQNSKIKEEDLYLTMTGTEMHQWDEPEQGDRVGNIGLARGEYVCLNGRWHSMIDTPKTGGIAYLPVTKEMVLNVLARHTGKVQAAASTTLRAIMDAADRQMIRETGASADAGSNGLYGYMDIYSGKYDSRPSHLSTYRNYTPAEPLGPPHPTPLTRKPREKWTSKDRPTASDYPEKHKLFDEQCD